MGLLATTLKYAGAYGSLRISPSRLCVINELMMFVRERMASGGIKHPLQLWASDALRSLSLVRILSVSICVKQIGVNLRMLPTSETFVVTFSICFMETESFSQILFVRSYLLRFNFCTRTKIC